MAVEKSSQTQTQLQALSVYLSAQQSRLIQTSARVDAVQKDLDTAARNSKVLANRVADLQIAMVAARPDERVQIQEALTATGREAAQAAEYATQIQVRQAAAAADMQTELARWADLIGKLEQAIKQ
jgi:hypothetical protein